MALAEGVQSQLVCDLSCVHGIGKILLVGEHQQHGVTQLILQKKGSRSDRPVPAICLSIVMHIPILAAGTVPII